ncbi:MAG: hypothetical protein WA160_15875 [Pseudobdellovibrio sp.]
MIFKKSQMQNRKSKLLLIAIFASSVNFFGCTGSNPSAAVSSIQPPPATTKSLVDVKQIVSVGAGLNFNALTGSWSEMASDPITNAPAALYYDRSASVSAIAGAMKYAYMDATGNWNVEVVDVNTPITAITNTCGGGAASANCIGAPNIAVPTVSQPQIYDLNFLSNGTTSTAVAAYAFGSGGAGALITGKSIRFAVRGSTGVWAVETAVPGSSIVSLSTAAVGPQLATLEYAVKGIRMLVDSSNRVHLTFGIYAATANNSVMGYTMRTAAGVWTTPVVVTTAAPSVLAFVSGAPTYAASTGIVQTGAAWCKYATGGTNADASGIVISMATTDNTPAASTQGFILKCATANTDGSCATWQGLDFHAGCVGAAPCITTTPAATSATSSMFSRSDLAVDPTTGKIFISHLATLPTPFTAPAALTSGILSTQSSAACDSGLSTAAWSSVRAHPGVAQGTLGLRVAADGTNFYMASLAAAAGTSISLNKVSSALAANWAAVDQVTIDSSTNTIGGGFLYNATTGVLWGSYGAFTAAAAGATGNDLKVFATYPSEIASTNLVFNSWNVDQTNSVSQATATPMLDAAIAPNGNVGYAYFYQEPGAAPGVNSHLYYGIRGGNVLSPVFGERLVSNSIGGATTFTNGSHPSMAFDSVSNPVISFLNLGVAASSGFLMVARSNNGGASFSLETVDGSAVTTNNVGQFPSVQVSTNNTIGISYYDFSTGATGQRLKFAKREKNGSWKRFVVDGPGSAGTNGCLTTATSTTGMYSKFKWTTAGLPVMVYQSQISGIKSLRMAYATESESSNTYTWTCLTLDSVAQATNVRGESIDFYLNADNKPYIIHYDATVPALRVVTCDSAVQTCAANGASAFTSERLNYVVGSVTSLASRPGIRADSTGKIWISFHGSADYGVFLASKTSGVWTLVPETVEASPVNASSTFTGQYGVLLMNSSNYPMLFYRGFENWIKYFSRESN